MSSGDAFYELETLAYGKLFPESLRRLRRWYGEVWPDAHELVPRVCREVREQLLAAPSLAGLLVDVSVTGRVKAATSTFRKLLRDSIKSIELVRDVVALRIVVTPADDVETLLQGVMGRAVGRAEAEALLCHGAHRQLQRMMPEVPGRMKDFIRSPKPNGYQSIHTNVRLPDGRVIEVQIRSAAMHQDAEYGVAAHHLYRATQLGGVAKSSEVVQAALQAARAPRALPLAGTTSSGSG